MIYLLCSLSFLAGAATTIVLAAIVGGSDREEPFDPRGWE